MLFFINALKAIFVRILDSVSLGMRSRSITDDAGFTVNWKFKLSP